MVSYSNQHAVLYKPSTKMLNFALKVIAYIVIVTLYRMYAKLLGLPKKIVFKLADLTTVLQLERFIFLQSACRPLRTTVPIF